MFIWKVPRLHSFRWINHTQQFSSAQHQETSSKMLQTIWVIGCFWCCSCYNAVETIIIPCFVFPLLHLHRVCLPVAVCLYSEVCYFLFELTCSPSVPWPPLWVDVQVEHVWQKRVQLWLSQRRSGRLNLDPSSVRTHTQTHILPNNGGT